MPKASPKPVDAEEIAEMADRQDISAHFTNQFAVVRPAVQRVNVDFDQRCIAQQARQSR